MRYRIATFAVAVGMSLLSACSSSAASNTSPPSASGGGGGGNGGAAVTVLTFRDPEDGTSQQVDDPSEIQSNLNALYRAVWAKFAVVDPPYKKQDNEGCFFMVHTTDPWVVRLDGGQASVLCGPLTQQDDTKPAKMYLFSAKFTDPDNVAAGFTWQENKVVSPFEYSESRECNKIADDTALINTTGPVDMPQLHISTSSATCSDIVKGFS